ncbi:hypothetical protein P9J64_17205 [Deltaproteobacteria bacterium IMCC39524]|nr:hypothetical protein [Deltaproteobacteria bacterium IMCC39524]
MMTGKDISKIEIRSAGSDEFYFVFRLPCDGMFVSIFFENMSEVVAAVENIKRNSTEEACYIRNTTSTEQLYFIFTAKDKEPIGQSTRYKYSSSMDAGLQYMKNHLLSAEVVDLTT